MSDRTIPLSDLSSAGLMITFYCLRFETSPGWRAKSPYLYPPGQRGPVIPPGTGFPFRRLLRLAGIRWRYSNPPPHGILFSIKLKVRVTLAPINPSWRQVLDPGSYLGRKNTTTWLRFPFVFLHVYSNRKVITVHVFYDGHLATLSLSKLYRAHDRMTKNVKQLVEWKCVREAEILTENLPQCQCFPHKSDMTWPVMEPGLPRWKNRLITWTMTRISLYSLTLYNLFCWGNMF
jgi:hypothetical protein